MTRAAAVTVTAILFGLMLVGALGAVIAFHFGLMSWASWALPVTAIAGASVTTVTLLLIGRWLPGTLPLILTGIALSSLAGALISLALNLDQGKAFTAYRCRNGLTDAASPLIVEGRHLANVFIGQFLLEPPDTAFFAAQARRHGFNEKEYLKAIAKVPVITEDRLPAILDFLTGFARMVAAQSMVSIRAETARQDLQRGRLAAMNLAEDAEAARAQVAAYKDQFEGLVKERTLKLQNIIDTAFVGIIVIDEAGLIQSFSSAASAIFGHEAEEMIGKNVSTLAPEGRPSVPMIMRQVPPPEV